MQNIETMAGSKGDSARLARLWKKLAPDEQQDAAATIAANAGRLSPDEAFSPGRFVTWSRKFSPEALQTIFGPQGAKSVANLKLVSEEYKNMAASMNNSRSGAAMVMNLGKNALVRGGPAYLLGHLIGGPILGTALGVGSAISKPIVQTFSARALMNPDVTRWMSVGMRQPTPQAAAAHIAKLSGIAARNPVIAQEVLDMQKVFTRAMNDNLAHAGRAAASPDQGPDNANQQTKRQ